MLKNNTAIFPRCTDHISTAAGVTPAHTGLIVGKRHSVLCFQLDILFIGS